MSGIVINELETILNAVQCNSPSEGFTHTFYQYPARFSPKFARAVINTFSKPGDVVLDPFMGSATTLVEALVLGRHAVGTDISSLAHFVAQVKLTTLSRHNIEEIRNWAFSIQPKLSLRLPSKWKQEWSEKGYEKDLPWHIRKIIELTLNQVDELLTTKQKEFARCALLRTAQWALDCKTMFPCASDFRQKFLEILEDQFTGLKELQMAISQLKYKPKVICLNKSAAELDSVLWQTKLRKKPTLVVTSPPYPNVHILYHRWQIKGRKETSAPFWIAGRNDGNGTSHYTMGSRTPTGLNNYFNSIQQSFGNIHKLLAKDSIVVQLIAFSNIEQQLSRYLDSMRQAGYQEVELRCEIENSNGRIWRQVPLRRWYATLKGNISSSRELLLIHKRLG